MTSSRNNMEIGSLVRFFIARQIAVVEYNNLFKYLFTACPTILQTDFQCLYILRFATTPHNVGR